MKRNIVTNTIVGIVFALAVMSLVPSASAQHCSLARAAGKYGITDIGTVVGVGPRTAVGILTLDAAGNAVGRATSSLNGAIADEAVSGTYTVNPDCTGTFSANVYDLSGNLLFTATLDLTWDDEDMKELRFIFTSVNPPERTPLSIVISGNGRKMVPSER